MLETLLAVTLFVCVRIENTFEFLTQYDEPQTSMDIKFVKLLGELIAGCYRKTGILKMAYYLDGWLFSNLSVFSDPPSAELYRFMNKPRKRLWMFIMFLRRDPAVLKLFKEALIEVYGKESGNELYKIWKDQSKFDPREIELPRDMWNQRLFRALLSELPAFLKQKPRKTARELALKYGVSPSIFDATFEVGANKCRSMECVSCPFGDNQLCHKGEERLCSITSWLFPYYEKANHIIICNSTVCPIGEDLGKNMCTRQIDREIAH